MSTLALESTITNSGQGEDLTHAACPCNEDDALCGANVTGVPWGIYEIGEDHLCVVCVDLVWHPCPKCGA